MKKQNLGDESPKETENHIIVYRKSTNELIVLGPGEEKQPEPSNDIFISSGEKDYCHEVKISIENQASRMYPLLEVVESFKRGEIKVQNNIILVMEYHGPDEFQSKYHIELHRQFNEMSLTELNELIYSGTYCCLRLNTGQYFSFSSMIATGSTITIKLPYNYTGDRAKFIKKTSSWTKTQN